MMDPNWSLFNDLSVVKYNFGPEFTSRFITDMTKQRYRYLPGFINTYATNDVGPTSFDASLFVTRQDSKQVFTVNINLSSNKLTK